MCVDFMDYVSVVCARFVLRYTSHLKFVDGSNIKRYRFILVDGSSVDVDRQYFGKAFLHHESYILCVLQEYCYTLRGIGIRRSGPTALLGTSLVSLPQ